MSFIRLKKRVRKEKTVYYAYLVSNKWSKFLPKQKVKAYLGRYYKLDSKSTQKPEFKKINLLNLLKKELISYNFKQKRKSLFIHAEGYKVDLNKKEVLNNQTNKCVLGINQGFLCNYTLNKLLSFKPKSKNKKEEGSKLIKVILDSGIEANKEIFLNLFNKLFKKS